MKMGKLLNFFIVGLLCTGKVFAQGAMATFDATNWMTAIEKLYATYDEVQNSIKMIEQNYQKMQHMINEAQSLDWENIQWDGDFDFRNELKDADAQINKRLSYLRRAEDCFEKKTIKFGNSSFSYADLMTEEGWNGMGRAFADSSDNSFKNACDAWTAKLTDKQKRKILRQYNVTPSNYYRIKAKEALLKAQMTKVIGAAESELQNEAMRENDARINALMNKIMKGGTEKEIMQYTTLLQQEVIKKMELMKQQQEEAAAAQANIAMLNSADELDKQTKKDVINSMTDNTGSNYETNFLDEPVKGYNRKEDKTNIPKM